MVRVPRVLLLLHEGPRSCSSGIGYAAYREMVGMPADRVRLTVAVPDDLPGAAVESLPNGHRLCRFPRHAGADTLVGLLGTAYDVLHLHHHYLAELGLALRRRLQTPLVVTFHCCRRESLVHEEAWCRANDVLPGLLAPLCAAVERERALVGQADQVICVSRSDREFFRRWYPRQARPLVIPNRFDPCLPPAPEEGSVNGDRPFVFVGRPDVRKGLHVLLRALCELNRRPVTLLIVGLTIDAPAHPGASLVQAYLAKVAQFLPAIPPGVTLKCLGWITRREVLARIAAARAVIIPSLYDACSLTALDALVLEKSIIASRAPGLVELLGDRSAVRFFDTGNAVQLADHLAQAAAETCHRPAKRLRPSDARLPVSPYLEVYRQLCL